VYSEEDDEDVDDDHLHSLADNLSKIKQSDSQKKSMFDVDESSDDEDEGTDSLSTFQSTFSFLVI
jgi:hypothetical protein